MAFGSIARCVERGIENRVIDSASIEVNRRARRTKTDRIDARKLVILLVRVYLGDTRACRTVRVPTVAEESARQVSRDRSGLVEDRTRMINQMRGWLATWGVTLPTRRGAAWWTTIRDWTGAIIPDEVQARLARAAARLAVTRGPTRRAQRGASDGRAARAGGEPRRPAAATQRRRGQRHFDAAPGRLGVARLQESSASRRDPRLHAGAAR